MPYRPRRRRNPYHVSPPATAPNPTAVAATTIPPAGDAIFARNGTGSENASTGHSR